MLSYDICSNISFVNTADNNHRDCLIKRRLLTLSERVMNKDINWHEITGIMDLWVHSDDNIVYCILGIMLQSILATTGSVKSKLCILRSKT